MQASQLVSYSKTELRNIGQLLSERGFTALPTSGSRRQPIPPQAQFTQLAAKAISATQWGKTSQTEVFGPML